VGSEQIDVTTDGSRATVALRGEFDMAATFTVEPALERLLDLPQLEALTLDLAAVRFIDSTGVNVVLRVHDEAQRREIALAIEPGPPEVQRVFEVAGLADVLPFA
jgi:anti-sigma B factor antagonist